MLRIAAIVMLLLVAGCATAGAGENERRCSWAAGEWSTSWATNDGLQSAPLTLRITPGGLLSGVWGDPIAGEVGGEAVGPDGATLVGWWTASMDRRQQGGFLLHLTTPEPDEHGLCRFEGVYTFGAGQEPAGWFGERAAH